VVATLERAAPAIGMAYIPGKVTVACAHARFQVNPASMYPRKIATKIACYAPQEDAFIGVPMLCIDTDALRVSNVHPKNGAIKIQHSREGRRLARLS
jgi:hypothetical protein